MPDQKTTGQQGKGAFNFNANEVNQWDGRQVGQALRPILARVQNMDRTEIDNIVSELKGDPQALAALVHLRETASTSQR